MTYFPDDLDRALSDLPESLREAVADQLRADGLLVEPTVENAAETAPTVPLNLDNLLKDLAEEPDPLPPPPGLHPGDGPGPNLPGVKGRSGRDGTWHLPSDSEYIDEHGYLQARAVWTPPPPKKTKRRLSPLDDANDIQRELGKLYADFHHGRVTGADFTRRTYALATLAQIYNQSRKSAIDYAQKVVNAPREV